MNGSSEKTVFRVYLDTCVYNRPFDDQTQPRIWLETLAFSVIMQMVQDGLVTLLTSSVVAYETSRNPSNLARSWVRQCIGFADHPYQLVNAVIRQRAETLERQGFKAMDALHLACAESTHADYFVTCDDRLARRYQATDGSLEVCDPAQFVRFVTGE